MATATLSAFASTQAEPLFPTVEGTTWEYRQTGAEPNQLIVRIAGKESAGGKEMLRVETVVEGDQVVKTELLEAGERGLLCHQRRAADGEAVPFKPPRLLLPTPLQAGTTWEVEDEVGGALMQQRFKVVAEEKLTVPAGVFQAYHLHCEQPWPISVSVDRWFAPGTGIIKDVATTRGPNGRLISRVETVLTKFSVIPPGPPRVPSPSPSPSPAPEPTSAATPAPQPRILLEVAKERDGEATTDFRSDAPNIYVRWNGEDLPTYSIVRVAWIAEDVGDVVEPNFIIDQTETEITSPEFGARFTLSRPKDGWAPGKYRVELYLEEELIETVRVDISD